MLMIRRNLNLLLILAKRCLSDGPFKGNKHYEFCIRHIKTDLNNHSYIVKQTTAIPKSKNNLSPITYKDIPYIISPQTSYNSLLPSTKQSILKVTNDKGNTFLEKNVYMQDVNTSVTYYSTKEHNPYFHDEAQVKQSCSTINNPSFHASTSGNRDDIYLNNKNDKEYINSNYQENYSFTTRSFHDGSSTNDGNRFSLIKIKELLNEKLKDAAMTEFNMKNRLSDDLVILNQKIPERESLLFFNNNDLHVIESSHTHFKKEVKKYIKELKFKESNESAPERLNLIRFSKLYSPDTLVDDPDSQNSLYFTKNNISEYMSTSGSCRNSSDTTLKVKDSIPLEKNTEKNWIEYEEDCNNCKEVNKDENGSYIGFSPQSGPPFTEKVPINKDKLIEENVVPNSTSILNIINSIDKSAVIIQKDLYITDQIIQKIQKEEEEEKNKETDNNKLETSAKNGVIMYLGTPSKLKNGMVTLSLAGLSAGVNKLSTDDNLEERNNSDDVQSYIVKEKPTEEKNKSLKKQYLSNNENVDTISTKSNGLNNEHNNLSASLTLNSIDHGGKISLNMLYKPSEVVPLFSFLSTKESVEENSESNNRALGNIILNNNNHNDNTNRNNLINSPNERKSEDHQSNYKTAANLQDNKQKTSNTIKTPLKLLENKSSQQRRMTDNNSIPQKKMCIDDSNRISSNEGLLLDNHVNRYSTVVSQNNQQPNIGKNPSEQTEKISMEGLSEHIDNKLNHSTLYSQDDYYYIQNNNNDNTNRNNLINLPNERKSQDHQSNYKIAANLQDNKQKTSNTINTPLKLMENKSSQQRKITDNNSIPHKKMCVDDSNRISPSEGLLLDNPVNRYSTVVSQNNQQLNIRKNHTGQTMEGLYEHNDNQLNHSTLNSQDEYYYIQNNNNDNTNRNNLINSPNESKSQDHRSNHNTAANLQDNLQQTSNTIKKCLKLLEKISSRQRTITDKDKNNSILQKEICVDDSNRTSPCEELLLDNPVNRYSTVVSQNNQQPNIRKNPKEQTENKSIEGLPEHNDDKLNHSTLNSQDENYKFLIISKEQIQKIENELSKLKNLQSKKQISSETLSEVEKLLETFIKDNHLKKEISVSNGQINESKKNDSNPPKEDADHIAKLIVQSVKESLENWLKENFGKKDTDISRDIKHESEVPYAEAPLKKSCYVTQNIAATGETLLNDCSSMAETPVSDVNYSDRGTLMDYDVNLNKALLNSEDNYYQPSNTTNSPPEVMEYDFQKQEETTYESEKKNSEVSEGEEPIHLQPQKEMPNVNYPPNDHDQFFNPNITETSSENNSLLQTKNVLADTKFSRDNIQELNNKSQNTSKDNVNPPQFYSFKFPNETSNKSIIDKDSAETSRSITKEGSIKKNRAKSIFDINSSEKHDDDVEFPFKNNTGPDHSIRSVNKSKELLMRKSDYLNPPELSSISDTSGKVSVKGRKKIENLNKFFSTKKNLDSSKTNNSPVNHVRKTTICAVEQNDFTDINVSEVQTYVDSRLPIPFSTETFFQMFGSNNSLKDHSSYIDVAKYKLSSPNKITDQQTNLSVLAKLNDIHRSLQHLNLLTMNKNLLEIKDVTFKNKALIPSKEVSKISINRHESSSKKEQIQSIEPETPKEIREPFHNKQNVSNFIPKFPLKVFKNNNLSVKAHNLKEMNKKNLDNKINISEIKKQDHKTPPKSEKSLLVMEPKNDNIKENKTEPQKRGIQEPALTGIKVSRGKYVDLFSFNKNEKNKLKDQSHKKGIYDHRGLSKRDRKILREITKEIPKKKSKGKSNRKRPIRPITSRKTGNEIVRPMTSLVKKSKDPRSEATLPKKDRESMDNTVIPNTRLSNKQQSPTGKNEPEKKEVQKTFNFQVENMPKNVIPSVKKSVEIKNLSKSEGRKLQDVKIDKTVETIKISEAKLNKAEKFNVLKSKHLGHSRNPEKISVKKSIPRIVNNESVNFDKNSNKPFCQTYVATEAYINQPEKIHQVPEKIFTSEPISKKNQTSQKVTILENNKINREDYPDTVKIPEGFKEDLIRKSQKKIENKTNIDFRVRMPKLKNTKQKLTLQPTKQDNQKHDIKNKPITPKKNFKNKLDRLTPKEMRTSKQASTTSKANQTGPQHKEKFSRPKPTAEVINNKLLDRMALIAEKKQENEQLKIATTDKSKPPSEFETETMIGQSESNNKKHFPTFLIDVDKMSKEIKPELDYKNCQKCQVAHEKITDFPLHNQKKKLLFKPPFKILNLGPNNDPMLRNELKLFPSVTKVLNSTIPESSREVLREWRKSMIDELGENGFKSFYKGQLVNGNKFNWQLHNFLLNREQYKPETDNLSLKSIGNVLGKTSDLSAINSHVIHRKLAYRGVIDCVAKYQNKPVLIEWKRLENSRVEIANSSIDVAATQLSAYVGALNHDETYKFQISGGLLVLAFNDGSEAEVIEINNEQCYKHWKLWLKRLQSYHELSRKKTK